MKEKVLEFMREKDRILYELTNLHIFDEELFEQTISEETCVEMVKNIKGNKGIYNREICPWCVQYNCVLCPFGYRYDTCDEGDSLYQKVYRKVPDFIDAPGMKAAVRRLLK